MRALSLLAIAAALLMVACDGDDDGSLDGPTPTATVEMASAEEMCTATHGVDSRVLSPELIETSGIAASIRNQEFGEVFWAHNDSGDTARFFAMDANGDHRDVFNLVGAEAIDIEDMAVGPGPEEGVSYVYLADIGDNDEQREEIVIYRVPEPLFPTGIGTPFPATDVTMFDTLTLRYPDGAHDAETFLVDPASSDLIIATKNIATGVSQVFRGDAAAGGDAAQTLDLVGEIEFAALRDQIVVPEGAGPLASGLPHIPTGGDVSPDGSLVAIRTYGAVFIWERPDGAPLADAFNGEPCLAPSVVEQQGEAIAFHANGSGYITISEGLNPQINEFVVE